MNNTLLKEREKLYKQRKKLRDTQFKIPKKSQSICHYERLVYIEEKFEFYDKFIKALNKSKSS